MEYNLCVRRSGLLACVLFAGSAKADDRFEASGFVGLDYFGANNQLGNSWAPEQVPGTAPMVGARGRR